MSTWKFFATRLVLRLIRHEDRDFPSSAKFHCSIQISMSLLLFGPLSSGMNLLSRRSRQFTHVGALTPNVSEELVRFIAEMGSQVVADYTELIYMVSQKSFLHWTNDHI